MADIRLGIHLPPTIPPERLRDLARAAERSGLDDLWVWEDSFKQSGIATATAALAWTETIRVGISLMPVPLRNTALTAMEIATVARLFPGRFVAGLGHGVQDWMAQAGVRVGSPLTLLTEQVTAIRRLLAGETVTTSGRYVRLDRVELRWPPAVVPPLMLGGSGPKSIALAAELGDGNLLTQDLTEEQIRSIAETVREVKAAAGRPDANRPEIMACELVATGPDAQRRLDAELPLWNASPGRGIGVAGTAAEIAAQAARLGSHGVTMYGAQATTDEPDLEGLINFLGHEVKPLLAKGI